MPPICKVCGASLEKKGRAWICPTQRAEPKGITPARRSSIRRMLADIDQKAGF